MSKQPEDASLVPEQQQGEEQLGEEQLGEEQLGEQQQGVAAADGQESADTPNVSGEELGAGEEEVGEVDAVQTLRAELVEAQNRALRLNAELDNFRKRSVRTIEEERKYASLPLVRDLLSVLDNLQRAIQAARQNEGSAGLLEGVEMVADQLVTTLVKYHCTEIPADGVPFDPHLHEAIAQFPSDDKQPGEIMQVTQVGYQLHDRVVRPSQVILAAPPRAETSSGDS